MLMLLVVFLLVLNLLAMLGLIIFVKGELQHLKRDLWESLVLPLSRGEVFLRLSK